MRIAVTLLIFTLFSQQTSCFAQQNRNVLYADLASMVKLNPLRTTQKVIYDYYYSDRSNDISTSPKIFVTSF